MRERYYLALKIRPPPSPPKFLFSQPIANKKFGLGQGFSSVLPSCLMFTKSVTVSVSVSKMGVLIEHRSESQWTVLPGYLTISNVRCCYQVVYSNFVFQHNSALSPSCIQQSPTAALQNSELLSHERWPDNIPDLNSTD